MKLQLLCLLSAILKSKLAGFFNPMALLQLTVPFIIFTLSAQVSAQTPFTRDVTGDLLQQVMPQATGFSEKSGEPPVFTAYGVLPDSGETGIIGYVFQTSDMPPLEVGFSAPIEVLVALDTQATITAIKILDYNESFRSSRGDFMSARGFQEQFRRKPLTDEFRVGRDIDGVSRATITSWATTRGIYNAARRVAQVYLPDSGIAAGQDSSANLRAHLEPLTWDELKAQGMVKELAVALPDSTVLNLSFAFLGNNETLGELLVGAEDYSRAERDASNRFDAGALVLTGIGGNASDPFRQERLSLQQNGVDYEMPRRRFVYAGSAMDGKIARQAQYAGAMVLPAAIDLSQPFTIFYDPVNGQTPSSLEFQVTGLMLDVALGNEILAPGAERENAASSSDVNWTRVLALLVIFALVMATFITKNARLRWLTLSVTLVYLGFFSGGFLSVSHITNTINLGPSMILSDIPLLMIVVFTLVTTLIWGRVFCSTLCPFGAVQDFLSKLVPKRFQKTVPMAIHNKAIYIKYAILALIVVMAFVQGGVSIFQYFEPFGTLFFYSTSIVLWSILILILLASAVVKRFYCRYACPLGAALGVLSLISLSRIKRVQQCTACTVCEHACPTGAIERHKVDFKECVRCDICESKLIQKAGVCRHTVDSLIARGVKLIPLKTI
ncbi:MAG: 4Fe-4S binding protein [Pseudohongiella sp.]|nr:4Fe-4S binding protein [Pseudohongiella sp.]MDO9521754.1 4Fe-4S binding protein [Pseudohongiella sp.]